MAHQRKLNLTRHATGKRLDFCPSKDFVCTLCDTPWHDSHLLRQGLLPKGPVDNWVCPRCDHTCCCQVNCTADGGDHTCCHLRRKQMKERIARDEKRAMEARNSQRGELKRARVAPNTAVAVPYRGVVLPTSVPTVFHSSRRVPPSSSSSTPLLAPSSSPAVVLPIAAPLVFPPAEEEDAASFGFGSVGSPSLYSMFGSLPPMEDISADMSVLDGFDWCEGDDSFGDLTLPPSAFVSVHTPPAMLSEHVHSEAVSGDSVEVIDLPDTRLHGFTFRACVCGCWERLSLHALPARTSPALSTLSPSSSSGGVITIMALPPQADVAHMCVELRCLPDLPAAWSLSVTPGGTPVLHTVTVSSLLEVGVNSLYLHVYSPLTAEV